MLDLALSSPTTSPEVTESLNDELLSRHAERDEGSTIGLTLSPVSITANDVHLICLTFLQQNTSQETQETSQKSVGYSYKRCRSNLHGPQIN